MFSNLSRNAVLCLVTVISLMLGHTALAEDSQGKWTSGHNGHGLKTLEFTGAATLLGNPSSFTVTFHCDRTETKTEHGTLGFTLTVHDVTPLKDFHFDDFDGPDAVAQAKKLVRVEVSGSGASPVTFDLQASGSYTDENAFSFGVSALSSERSEVKTLLESLGKGTDLVVITVTDFQNAGIKLMVPLSVRENQTDFEKLLAEK